MSNARPEDNTEHDSSVFTLKDNTTAQGSNMDECWETRSHCSSASRSSQCSTTSALAAQARAKAEAARAQASFAEKEAQLIKEQAYIEAEAIKKKAELSAELHALQLKNAAAAAIIEAEILEAAAEDEANNICFPRKEVMQRLVTDPSVVHQPENTQALTQAASTATRCWPPTYDQRFHSSYDKQPPMKIQPRLSPAINTNESGSSATSDLAKYLIRRDLTPREELDLLCKWLGPESSEQAKRIRAVHIYDATAGVRMLWQRLEDSYGSPEAIENALLAKLEDFPKSQTEQWITAASHYKEFHKATYPPFSVFVKFVCDKAKTLNDPCFAPLLFTGGPNVSKPDKVNTPNLRATVSVCKTAVITPDNSCDISENTVIDPDNECPLHNKPHSLRKCRGFRAKTLDERKAILKEMNICYKCCSSVSHIAKDCNANIQCYECKSNHHVTALHPGPAPWNVSTPDTAAPEEHGGEQQDNSTETIISKCTEICGKGNTSRSCSKICLAKIYPAGQKEKAVKVYVVLDEQKSLDGKISVHLPTLIECDMLPDDRSEIPTPDVTKHHDHLKPLVNKIPALDPNAEILVLLGRDIPQVHKVREHYNGPNDAPYAERLDLGWVVIGEVCQKAARVPAR
ncbi:hypothetical protein WMY93_003354 [Mugilogobius chulae]|uniref:Uncharacterized protein n=1 Tax=Mugilogobius chulae TaxID=88201 RepID=A0AAW0PWF2_9GOBI